MTKGEGGGYSETNDGSVPPGVADELYSRLHARMKRIAIGAFRLSPDVAENLCHDVFLTFFSRVALVHEPERWLLAAMRKACCRHVDRRRPTMALSASETEEGPEPGGALQGVLSVDPRGKLEARSILREVVRVLGDRCREILYLSRCEGFSATEIAAELGLTTKYAEKLIFSCTHRAKSIVRALEGEGRRG